VKPTTFRWALSLAFAATLVAAYFAPAPADDALQVRSPTNTNVRAQSAASSPVATRQRGATEQAIDVIAIRPRTEDDAADAKARLFSYPPPAVVSAPISVTPAAPVPVAAPQPPPMPFRVLGRYVEDGEAVIFLQHGEQNVLARVGDLVGEHYKVEEIQQGALILTYVPLGVKQVLDFGESIPKER
jgi:hypothetical protein